MRSGRPPRLLAAFGASLLAAAAHAAAPDLATCEAQVARRPGDLESYRCFRRAARGHGAWDGAIRSLRARLTADPANDAARLALASILLDRGDPEASPLFEAAASGFSRAGRRDAEVFARLGVVQALLAHGRADAAAAEISRAKAAVERSNDASLRARVQASEALLMASQLRYDDAAALLADAAAVALPDGPEDLRTTVLGAQGRVHWALGRFGRSSDAYESQAAIFRAAGDLFGEAGARYNVALLAGRRRAIGEIGRDELLERTQEAVDATVRAGNAAAEAKARLLLGQLLTGAAGIAEFDRALAISRRIGDRRSARFARRLLAWYVPETDPSRRDEARRWLDEVIEEAHRDGDLDDVARGHAVRAWLLWTTGQRDAWIPEHLEAIEAVERIRDLQSGEMTRARLFSQWAFVYYRFAGRLLDGLPTSPDPDRDLDLAFRTVERMRSRVLLDALDRSRARSDDRALRPDLPSLDAVRSLLDVDEALVSFHVPAWSAFADPRVYEGGGWAILVTRDEARAFAIPASDRLPDQVAVFLGLVRRRDGSESSAGAALHRALLDAPLARLAPTVNRLVVVPDGCLARLPFAALRPAEAEPPLVSRFAIEVVPSATLWARWRAERGSESLAERVLALADPFPPPSREDQPRAAPIPRYRTGVEPLPSARREAADMAAASSGGSLVLTGRDASETALKTAALERFGVLHLAAHAVVDDDDPERSAVVLARSETDDGFLQIREIVDLGLTGQTVILTACRSASGAWIEGEGVMALARAFLHAGSRAVVGSLWPLRDDESAALMQTVSRRLGRGSSVVDALAAAQRAAVARGAPPAAWAGLVLLGDGSVAPFEAPAGGSPRDPDESPAWPHLLVSVAAVALLLVLARRSKR